jgi:hypothetical protein
MLPHLPLTFHHSHPYPILLPYNTLTHGNLLREGAASKWHVIDLHPKCLKKPDLLAEGLESQVGQLWASYISGVATLETLTPLGLHSPLWSRTQVKSNLWALMCMNEGECWAKPSQGYC